MPNITIGAPVVACLRKSIPKSDALFDCHMMVSNPGQWVEDFAKAGCELYCFHYEAVNKGAHAALIKRIHELGMKAGVAIKPKTDVAVLYPLVEQIE